MSGVSLAHIVLHKLSERPLTGYSLCKEIEESAGRRPSYGSIYPILERMSQEGLVTVREEGRRKIYTLTEKGRRSAAEIKSQHNALIDQMISQSKLFCAVTGQDPEPMTDMLARLKTGKDPLKGISVKAIQLRDLLFRLSIEDRIKDNQREINAILEEAIRKLERL